MNIFVFHLIKRKRAVIIPAGDHSITWTYSKDIAISSGQDAGWIDKVEVFYEGSPEIIIEKNYTFEINEKIEVPFSFNNNPNSIGTKNLPNWLTIDQGAQLITGKAPEEGTFNFSLWAENDIGRASKDIRLEIIKPLDTNTPLIDWQYSGNSNWFSQ